MALGRAHLVCRRVIFSPGAASGWARVTSCELPAATCNSALAPAETTPGLKKGYFSCKPFELNGTSAAVR